MMIISSSDRSNISIRPPQTLKVCYLDREEPIGICDRASKRVLLCLSREEQIFSFLQRHSISFIRIHSIHEPGEDGKGSLERARNASYNPR